MSLIGSARNLFTETAARHKLTIEWDDGAPVELACWLRKQPGLDWDLWLNLQEDEIGVQHAWFTAEWFPATDPSQQAEFMAAVDGLVTGDVRFTAGFRRRGGLPYRVDLERLRENTWSPFFTYRRGLGFGRPESTQTLRNGYAIDNA